MTLPIILVVAVLAIVGLGLIMYVVGVFNTLVQMKERTLNGFAQIEVQLKRRHDLIPNLVEVAKGYMAHERDTLEAVIAARNQAVSGLDKAHADPGNPNNIQQLAGAESALTGAMGRLFAVMEAYPDLKANQNMLEVSEELTTTENKISFARQAYNDQATAYNIYKKQFPPVIFAGMFGHSQDAALLEFEDAAEIAKAPKVSFT
ncbi:MAG: LemA family protein [Phycisphaerales bacterium]